MSLISLFRRFILPQEGRTWLIKNTKNSIPRISVLLLLRIIGTSVGVLFALVTKNVVNTAIAHDNRGFITAVFLLLAIIVVEVFANSVASHLQEKTTYLMDRDLKRKVFSDILNSDYEAVSQYHSGDLLHRLNSDIGNIITSVLSISTSVISLIVSLIITAIALFAMEPLFTLWILPISVILSAVTILCERDLKKIHKAVSQSTGNLSGFLHEAIMKLLIVQGLDIADEIVKKSDILFEKRIQHQKKRKDIQVMMSVGSSVFGYTGGFISLVWCAFKLLNGEMDYGTLLAITALVGQLRGPLLALPTVIPKFAVLTASVERILEIEEIKKENKEPIENLQDKYVSIQCIHAENLGFSYKDKKEVLKPVLEDETFAIHTDGMTVVTGQSGGGKSTLLKLLLGIYSPKQGSIVLKMDNGTSIPIDRSTRRLFSYAPQGNLILSGTIKDNILIAKPDASEEEIENAVYVSVMDEYLKDLPQGIDTRLGENGMGLSEGQIQRINIARAILRGSPILLLDEVTSSLDIETEKKVLERINEIPGKTCIAVTHRPAALELAKWQLQVSNGKVKEIQC